ncbi:MAG: ATP-binding cassette domain-containing protein [Betaproteobacteria bacterium]|nr:MAG: ATP-binding cassette domain-containing protein [Betaproteobacteria bacterium]
MKTRTPGRAAPILSARDIVNRFGKQEVHDRVSLDILPGEIIGIAGGSGSGKSVLLKTLTGLHRPNAGQVLLNGKRIDTVGPAEKASLIGVLFQQGALFSSLSVAQNRGDEARACRLVGRQRHQISLRALRRHGQACRACKGARARSAHCERHRRLDSAAQPKPRHHRRDRHPRSHHAVHRLPAGSRAGRQENHRRNAR